MSLFLFTFFLLYGAVHSYAYLKARNALGFSGISASCVILFMIAMVLAPLLVRIAEKQGLEALARFLALTGYTWMGLLFLFFSTGIVLDLYHGMVWIAGKIQCPYAYNAPVLSATASFLIPLIFGSVGVIYGAFEASHITTERIVVATKKLPPGVEKVTIAQISDVHIGLIVRKARLLRIIEQVRLANPDLLVSTGDFVDGQIDGLSAIAQVLGGVTTRYGKFAVIGNHEVYAGLSPSLKITEEAGFRVLRGEVAEVGDIISVIGVDDPAVHRGDAARGVNEVRLLESARRDRFTLLLKHRPEIERQSLGLFDLQLSGHVHKGQIFPFNLLTHIFYPAKMGLSHYPHDSLLYVSRGSGTWGPPIRLLAPPEVTIIEVVSAPR